MIEKVELIIGYISIDEMWVEAHVIAYVYHWDRNTILKLSRGERRMWYDLIMKQKKAENRSSS